MIRKLCARPTAFLARTAAGTTRLKIEAAALIVLSLVVILRPAWTRPAEKGISREASARCEEKLDRLMQFAAVDRKDKSQTTTFSESEVNSYLALEVSLRYHSSLKSIIFTFEEDRLSCVATLDFDQLSLASTQFVAKILAGMFSGIHKLSIAGALAAQEGKAQFKLQEARFDATGLPNILVEEIISLVASKQDPPFDPMKPSEMPYRIRRVNVRPGHIDVIQ